MFLKKNETTKLVQVLNAGGVVIIPTDTLYGLACDALNPQALLKMYQVKQRPFGKAFPILMQDFAMLTEYAAVNDDQKKMMKKAKMPTTFILKAKKNLSPLALMGRTGAFRIPKDRWLKSVLREFGRPLIATSANIHKQKPLTDPAKYGETFGAKASVIDVIVLGGVSKKRKGSTIIDISKKPYKVVRK